MIHTILFIATLVAMFIYGMFATLPILEPREQVVGPEIVKVEVIEKKAADNVEQPVVEVVASAPVVDIERGKTLFMVNCISCHNKDPNIKGAIGPELTDAPLDLMAIKVRTGRYPDVLPEGFVPKRKTKQMKKFPQLDKDVASIHAWIQSVKRK